MSGARIVVVEDDESIQMITRMALEVIGGHQVTVFSSGEDALAGAAALKPDLLVLDVAMPGLDGQQTLQRMRQIPALEHTRAVFLTASTQAGQVAGLRKLGALDVIAKPFDPQQLCDRVARVLRMPEDAPVESLAQLRRALVIEDDPGVRYLLRFILEQQGWGVLEAATGPEGLAWIRGGAVTDAVLLDIMLPEIDGLELLRALRSETRWQGVPVMMLSARGDEAAVKQALQDGANDYLAKPFDPVEFTSRLQRLQVGR